MNVKGKIYTEVSVEPYEVIKKMCQSIDVVDIYGNLVAERKDDKIVTYWYNDSDEWRSTVLYDYPFDVEYAGALITLYKKTCEFLELSEEEKKEICTYEGDYRTACKLKVRKYGD